MSATVDVVDETFLAVPPPVVAAVFADAGAWPRFWPDLVLSVYADRGAQGLRWTVRGALVGTMEVWLEPVLDGTLLHYFLRADPAGPDGRAAAAGSVPARVLAAERRRRQLAAKRVAFHLKRRLEGDRPPGHPPVATA
nr:polyketide cyclase / dehydrase and lipid transport [Goodfellowiella coeruleoviolacea]